MLKFVLCGCVLLSACATPYQDGKFAITGGYFEQPVNSHLRKVAFYANGFTSIQKALTYAELRCAEIADENKKPYFLMYPSLNAAANDRPDASPIAGSIGGKPAAVAFLALSDDEVPGSIETSKALVELGAVRAGYESAHSTQSPSKKANGKK